MRTHFVSVLLLCCSLSCRPMLDVPDEVAVSCSDPSECPDNRVCASAIGLCVPGPIDGTSPRLLSAAASSPTSLTLFFDEPLVVASALFVFEPPLAVEEIALSEDSQRIELMTARQVGAAAYRVSVAQVVDWSGNLIADDARTAGFIGFGPAADRSPPDLLAPVDGATVRTLNVVLVWSARAGASSYEVEIARDESFSILVGERVIVPAAQTSITLPALAPHTFFWRVRSDLGAWAKGTFDAIGEHVHVRCPAERACAASTALDDREVGNLSRPYRSISRALAAAAVLGSTEVRVAARGGEQAYEELVFVQAPIILSGGWNESFSMRDPLASPTWVRRAATPVLLAAGLDRPTLIDGFHFGTSSGNVQAGAVLAIEESTAELEVRGCLIQTSSGGTSSTAVSLSYSGGMTFGAGPRIVGNTLVSTPGNNAFIGVTMSGSAPTIADNRFSIGSEDVGSATAIEVLVDSAAIVRGNVIDAKGASATGINVNIAQAEISQNTLTLMALHNATAITVSNAEAVQVQRNRIEVRTDSAFGLDCSGAAALEVINNVIVASGSFQAEGMALSNTGCADAMTVAHNTVLASADNARALVMGTFSVGAGHYANNIFAVDGCTMPPSCAVVTEYGTGSDPGAFVNNVLLGAPTLYLDEYATALTEVAGVNALDGQAVEINLACQGISGGTGRYAGNLGWALTAEDLFVSPQALDLRLEQDADSIAEGALDTRGAECAAVRSCGGVSVDQNGKTRTVPLSIGALERE
jgi:hypothetical protein